MIDLTSEEESAHRSQGQVIPAVGSAEGTVAPTVGPPPGLPGLALSCLLLNFLREQVAEETSTLIIPGLVLQARHESERLARVADQQGGDFHMEAKVQTSRCHSKGLVMRNLQR